MERHLLIPLHFERFRALVQNLDGRSDPRLRKYKTSADTWSSNLLSIPFSGRLYAGKWTADDALLNIREQEFSVVGKVSRGVQVSTSFNGKVGFL